uniref:Ig-like domain-containing protein n=1 Tax=Paenibacillus sp. 1-18 TaxID=1333846 RepID=UPI00046EF358
ARLIRAALSDGLMSEFGGSLHAKDSVSRVDAASLLVSALFPQERASQLQGIDGQQIRINGIAYDVAEPLRGIFHADNQAALRGAGIRFHATGRTVDKVTWLELRSSGTPAGNGEAEFSGNVVLDGHGSTLNGDLVVAGDFTSVLHLKVEQQLTVDARVQQDFYAQDVQVQGQTQINGGDNNTVVFDSSTLTQMDVTKPEVHVVLSGTASATVMNVQSNASIEVGTAASLSQLNINEGTDNVSLQGTVPTVQVTGSQSVEMTGNSTIQQLTVSGTGALQLKNTGSIENLQVSNPAATVNVSGNIQVSALTLGTGVASNAVTGLAVTSVTGTSSSSGGSSGSSSAANRSPEVVNASVERVITEGTGEQLYDLRQFFTDPDGDVLTFSAASLQSGVVRASVSGNTLKLTPVSVGKASISVSANDGRGKRISSTFKITVNGLPVSTGIPAQNLTVGQSDAVLHLNDYIQDPENAALTYQVTVDHPAVASAVLAGDELRLSPLHAGSTIVHVTANDGQQGEDGSTGQKQIDFNLTVQGAPSHAPQGQTPQPLTVTLGQPNSMLDLGAVFTDADSDPLVFTAASADTSIVQTSITGHQLTLQSLQPGSTSITLTADDSKGGTATVTLIVTVLPIPNSSPVVTHVPNAVHLILGKADGTVDLSTIFADPDHDSLRYEISSSAPAVADAMLQNDQLVIHGLAAGSTIITITATDGRGGEISTDLQVHLLENAVIAAIPEQLLQLENPAPELDLSPFLLNWDLASLSVTADTYDPGIATAHMNGQKLQLNPVSVGTTSVTLSVYDQYGRAEGATFPVIVSMPQLNHAPQVISAINEQVLSPGVTQQRDYDLQQLFSDEDGDELQFTVSSSDPTLVSVSLQGSSLTLAPGTGSGLAAMTITATDGKGGSVQYTFNVRNAELISGGITPIGVKYGLPYRTVDLSSYFPGQSEFLVYRGTPSSTFTGPVDHLGTTIALSPDPVLVWVVGTDGRAAVFQVQQDPQQAPAVYFSQFVDGGDGRIVLQLYYNGDGDPSHRGENYSLEVHQWMKNTNRMNVTTIPINPLYPAMPYLIIDSIFYDFMDITPAWYFNDEGNFYNPNEFNTVAYVLKYQGQVVDVLGNPNSHEQFTPQGGTFVRKPGISYGSPVYNQPDEWNAYPKGAYQFVSIHTP